MDGYEARQLANIKRNAELVQDLGLEDSKAQEAKAAPQSSTSKRRKLEPAPPTRVSRRLASAPSRPTTYNEDALIKQTEPEKTAKPRSRNTNKSSRTKGAAAAQKDRSRIRTYFEAGFVQTCTSKFLCRWHIISAERNSLGLMYGL